MPPPIQPQTLYNLSLSCVSKVVNVSCDNIQKNYGNYDQPECRAQVQSLQDFLLLNIPTVLMDEIAEDRKLRDEIAEDRKFSADARIKLALFMHSGMRKFSADFTWECRVVLDEFWITHLASLHKLVYLNLYLACTDEILQVVSENCPLLEEINIVSKVENCQNRIAGNFNALRLKLFVSDVGLGYLVQCQRLKRITTIKMLRSHCGGKMMTHDGLRTLVKGLPNLECLRYNDLGTVIASDMEGVSQLALTYLCDNHPSKQTIEAASRLCPNLTHICLCIPYGHNTPSNGSPAPPQGDIVATTLTMSSIIPTVLELKHFHFNDTVSKLLRVKGSTLTSLFLQTVNTIGVTELLMIGELCLNLENLHLKGLGSKLIRESSTQWTARVSLGIPIYKRLKCLFLSGKDWNVCQILDLFFMTAHRLTSLSLWNSTYLRASSQENPSEFDEFVKKHQFPELQTANFCPGCSLSLEAVHTFIYKCPKLTNLMLCEHEGLKPQDIQQLQKELVSRNLNIDLSVQEIM